jgi:hypothetical protein
MKIYKYQPDSDSFDSVLLKESDFPIRRLFSKGKKITQDLSGLELESYEVGQLGDFPSLHGWIPVVSLEAWEKMKDKTDGAVQPLMVKCGATDYVMLNVLDVVDCLDKENSILIQNTITKQVSSIEKYSFFEENLEGKMIFKLPETSDLEAYVTEDFRVLVEDKKLKGLYFDNPLNEG